MRLTARIALVAVLGLALLGACGGGGDHSDSDSGDTGGTTEQVDPQAAIGDLQAARDKTENAVRLLAETRNAGVLSIPAYGQDLDTYTSAQIDFNAWLSQKESNIRTGSSFGDDARLESALSDAAAVQAAAQQAIQVLRRQQQTSEIVDRALKAVQSSGAPPATVSGGGGALGGPAAGGANAAPQWAETAVLFGGFAVKAIPELVDASTKLSTASRQAETQRRSDIANEVDKLRWPTLAQLGLGG